MNNHTTTTPEGLVNSKYCRDCGAVIAASATVCPKCGGRQAGSNFGAVGNKSRVVAAVLAFFLGFIGVHKFYLEQNGQGIIYLLFCWTGVPILLSIIDLVRYLIMSDDAFAQKYT